MMLKWRRRFWGRLSNTRIVLSVPQFHPGIQGFSKKANFKEDRVKAPPLLFKMNSQRFILIQNSSTPKTNILIFQ
jgi:hypothetical protein